MHPSDTIMSHDSPSTVYGSTNYPEPDGSYPDSEDISESGANDLLMQLESQYPDIAVMDDKTLSESVLDFDWNTGLQVERLTRYLEEYDPSYDDEPRGQTRKISTPWVKAMVQMMENQSDYLILTNVKSSDLADRELFDTHMAEIVHLQSILAGSRDNTRGKEIASIKYSCGCPPFTFTKMQHYSPGSKMSLAQSWQRDGIQTMTFDSIKPEPRLFRRQAIMYGIGPERDMGQVQSLFRQMYQPPVFETCIALPEAVPPEIYKGPRFFFQIQLSNEESARALGLKPDDDEFIHILEVLKDMQIQKLARETTIE